MYVAGSNYASMLYKRLVFFGSVVEESGAGGK